MKKVFINYSWNHDSEIAEKVYDELSATKEFDVWKDKKKIAGGREWRSALRDAIRKADAFICIMSKGSMTGRRAVRFEEINIAIEVLKEFPPDEIYLIPTRVDDCKSRFPDLDKLDWVDLFPKIDTGINKLIESLRSIQLNSDPEADEFDIAEAKPQTNLEAKESYSRVTPAPARKPTLKNTTIPTPKRAISTKKHVTPMHRYSIGLVDIDMGMSDLTDFVLQLNNTQSYFLFKSPQMPDISGCTETFTTGINFAVYNVPESYISEHPQLASDLVACFTKRPLAFYENGYYYHNYFAGPSEQDKRFMFVSADKLDVYAAQAGRSTKEGLISILVSQLIAYFTNMDYHNETRSCVMDFCGNRTDIIYSLKSRKLCDSCSKKLPHGDLRIALLQLLALNI